MLMVYLNKSNTMFCEQTLISEIKLRLAFHMFLLPYYRLEYTMKMYRVSLPFFHTADKLMSNTRGFTARKFYPYPLINEVLLLYLGCIFLGDATEAGHFVVARSFFK